ncbi:hypothetical protein G9C98_006332 [Cotesia typhae]|uniref:MOG interacting and ectopic P-granules protein 1 n=1 Tax=Cotesia typhae TaxID=2053667 RepID=A0A8J5QXG2_9HYME|nr:hypothetical protein G9C98_006332 [Cotesia typhae]
MEGTLEEPVVKDPSCDSDVAKDQVIPNGINGNYDDSEKHDDIDDMTSNKMDADAGNDDDAGGGGGQVIEDEEEEEDDPDNDNYNANKDEQPESGEHEIEHDVGEENLEEENPEENQDEEEQEQEQEEEEEEELEDDGDEAKKCDEEEVIDGELEENKEYETMDVDNQDNSDVECLDEDNAPESLMEMDVDQEMIEDVEGDKQEDDIQDEHVQDSDGIQEIDNVQIIDDEHNEEDDDVRAVSESSDVQQLNDSIVSVSSTGSDLKICEENGSIGSPDIEEITDLKSNGPNKNNLERTPVKESKPKKARKQIDLSNITPRRSSRNIKRTSYIEKEPEEEVEVDNSSDIEEIKPEDPLACIDSSVSISLTSSSSNNNHNNKDKENSKLKSPIKSSKTTIVVNDTKRLVEIAASSNKSSKGGGKKEPTLVIIDTNSILSGRGGVPIGSSHSSTSSSKSSHHHSLNTSGFSVLPINLSTTQTMYPNMRTTITPVPMTSKATGHPRIPSSITAVPTTVTSVSSSGSTSASQILPTLTDDMFVVEAPSFIVPYVYEKPPIKPLKEFVTKLEKCIEEVDREEKAAKAAKKEAKKAEGKGDSSSESGKYDSDDGGSVKSVSSRKEGGNANDSIEVLSETKPFEDKNKMLTYFDLPLGKFFMQIGVNLVQEFVQTDLLRSQKRRQGKTNPSAETQMAINSLIKNLEFSKENNEPFHLDMKKCEFCNFKTESALVMQHHLETPHMRNYVYKCNFCPLEVRSPHDILYHMEAEHNTRGRLERGPAFHQCPNCPFEDNQKGKLTRHILACAKKFRPERNLEPSTDWEPPAKIPRLNRPRQVNPMNANAALALAMSAKGQQPLLPKLLPAPVSGRGRGRPPMQPRYCDIKSLRPGSTPGRQDNVTGMMYRPTSSGLLVPTSYQFGSNQVFQNSSTCVKNPAAKLLSQPSISITPLPRTTQAPISSSGSPSKAGKTSFVICEICDGYIKDLEQLRNHMQWIHKVKIHPKMIYNRPPLNCQKCQFRFFTDQGLERHLLGSHGLVTSSMQEAANKGKDAGRCPACGRVYQWKLLNHVARDHGMTLKPAHLSYKCTVCTATFGMYKQFENHVYSAHSVVAKRVMDKKNAPSTPSSRSNDSLLKPLKINDEITIIPQPAKSTRSSSSSQGRSK